MTSPLRIALFGTSGRMGRTLIQRIEHADDLQLALCVERSAQGFEPAGATTVDVAIDFTLPTATMAIADWVVEQRTAWICGTTGLSDPQQNALATAARSVPTLWASNFSLGAVLLKHFAKRTRALWPQADAHIHEVHHAGKRDQPSGTALSIGQTIEPVTYSSARIGDIIGEHDVRFERSGETISLHHRAHSRTAFADGALAAARWSVTQPAGLYGIDAIIDL